MTGPDPDPDPDPVLAIAAGLAASLDGMAGQLGKLGERQDRADRRDRRQRLLVRGLVISLTLDLLITAGLGYNTIRQDSVQVGIRGSDIRQCQLANITRQQDIAIWNRLLHVPATATAAQKAEVADLERLVRAKDAPRDCTTAYAK